MPNLERGRNTSESTVNTVTRLRSGSRYARTAELRYKELRVLVAIPGFAGLLLLPILAFAVRIKTFTLSSVVMLCETNNFITVATSYMPIIFTTLVARRFDHGADEVYRLGLAPQVSSRGITRRHDDFGPAELARVAQYGCAERVLWAVAVVYTWLLLVAALIGKVMHANSEFCGLLLLSTVGSAIAAFLIRNLLVAVLLAEQAKFLTHINRGFRLRVVATLAGQSTLFAYVIARSTTNPILLYPVVGDTELNPCINVTAAYMSARCVDGLALEGPRVICHDGGYRGYNSTLAACEAARSQTLHFAHTHSALMLSINLIMFVLFSEIWRLHEKTNGLDFGVHEQFLVPQPLRRKQRMHVLHHLKRGRQNCSFLLSDRAFFRVAKICTFVAVFCCAPWLGLIALGAPSVPSTKGQPGGSIFVRVVASGTIAGVNGTMWAIACVSFNINYFKASAKALKVYLKEQSFVSLAHAYHGRSSNGDPEGGGRVGKAEARRALETALVEAARDLGGLRELEGREGGSHRFMLELKSLTFGEPQEAALGLAQYMCVPQPTILEGMLGGVRAIEIEINTHGTAVDREVHLTRDSSRPLRSKCLHYVLHAAAGSSELTFQDGLKRDCGPDGGVLPSRLNANGEGMRLEDFILHANSVKAKLDPAHVAALRLYSTAAYNSLNMPLRDASRRARGEPHLLPVTIAFIDEAVRKLRALRAGMRISSDALDLYRGMKNVQVGDLLFQTGGTEVAPMSCTSNLGVALRYCASPDCVLLRLRTKTFMDCGADLWFISAFPAENEYLFPPLSYMRPTGKPMLFEIEEATITVVDVEVRL